MMLRENAREAIPFLKKGEVIAYPTEAVYGLGCDPFNEKAVHRLLRLKHREIAKGFILIASNWRQVERLVNKINPAKLAQAIATWPGPYTWVFPASTKVPPWLLGYNRTIAIRITSHLQARELCDLFNAPLISTSANITGKNPARSYEEVLAYFDEQIPFILKGKVGGLPMPTPIRDILTGRTIRS